MERKSSQSKIDYNSNYTKTNYTQLTFRVKKGQEDKIREFAKSQGMSLNGLINKLLEEAMGEQPKDGEQES